MKSHVVLIAAVAAIPIARVHAQAPPAIPYQAIARNGSGTIVASAPVGLRFTIHDSSPTGTVLYSETHAPTTSDQGSFNVNIGQGTVVTGTFAAINWGTNAKYLQVELDVAGGTSYVDMGTQQLMSVPFALYAGTTGGSNGWADSAGMAHNTNTTQRVGIGSTNPQARLHVADSSVVFTGPSTVGSSPAPVPVTGTGSRFMWVPQNSAFRAGFAYGTQWNADSIGAASIAMGDGPTASGTNAIAMGHLARAKANNAVAIGDSATATGLWATALGRNVTAMGQQEIVVGNNNYTSGIKNVQLGYNCYTISESNVTVGNNVVSYGYSSVAIGNNLETYNTSVALGANTIETISTSDAISIGVNNQTYGNGTAIGKNGYAFEGVVLGKGYSDRGTVVAGGHATEPGFCAVDGVHTDAGSDGVALLGGRVEGQLCLAIGVGSNANTWNQVAIGNNAIGEYGGMELTAIGNNVVATTRSVIMGSYASSIGFEGCMTMGSGDSPSAMLQNTDNYQMAMKFSGGYKFYTDAACTIGAEIAPGGNSWAVISDKRKKEQIVPVQGNSILGKIKNMTLGSWNYIGQSPETFRHYGPMAQDFYAAFGKDDVGTIGNDTTINQADMAGVTFSAVQALVCRTEDLAAKNEQLLLKVATLENNKKKYIAENEQLKAELTKRKKEIENRLETLENNTRKNYSATR